MILYDAFFATEEELKRRYGKKFAKKMKDLDKMFPPVKVNPKK